MSNCNIFHTFFRNDKEFKIEFLEFSINEQQIVHVEFYQILNGMATQCITANLKYKETISVFKQIIDETHKRYSDFDMAIFSSIDGNKKREFVYTVLVKKIALLFGLSAESYQVPQKSAVIYSLAPKEYGSVDFAGLSSFLHEIDYL